MVITLINASRFFKKKVKKNCLFQQFSYQWLKLKNFFYNVFYSFNTQPNFQSITAYN